MSINYTYNFPQLARDSGFKLRQYKDGPLDWRLIGCLEVERIMRDESLEQIDGILSHLSEAPLGSILDTNILDSGIAKYFVLSQFSIQYLLFCRKFLDETVVELRESLVDAQTNVGSLKKALAESNNEILQLHKKITQIEAIHEVVFPCHLCSKNFVSNEALNIHIGRKHGVKVAAPQQRNETPQSATQRDKDNDRTLINTIKLELEIKQLKERLNVAEKDIRERSVASSRRASPRPQKNHKMTKDVAIQSNLMEAKEKNDADDVPMDSGTLERKQQLLQLQEQVNDFEQWRDSQKANNDASMSAINKQLNDIVQSLEASKRDQQKTTTPPQLAGATTAPNSESPAAEDLQKLLSEKVAEIGRASAEKLEQVVQHMEQNYREKLNELEREIKKRSSMERKACALQEKVTSTSAHEKQLACETIEVVEKSRKNDDTYDVDEKQPEMQATAKILSSAEKKVGRKELKESISSESNRTFIKVESSGATSFKDKPKIQFFADNEESTDISDTLSDVTDSQQTSTEEDEDDDVANKKIHKVKITETKSKENDPKTQQKKSLEPVKFTRKDAQKMNNRKLNTLGYTLKTKRISNGSMKKVTAELTEQRNQLKEKYPNFNATRNRIKKFVDKLCSTKLPENAEAMLRRTEPQQPVAPVKMQRMRTPRQSASMHTLEANASTPLSGEGATTNEFKQRLNRILNSPMRRPGDFGGVTSDIAPLPVPLPRKRVMFNTLSDAGAEESASSEALEDSDFERKEPQRKPTKEGEKAAGGMDSSITSLL